MVDQNNKVRIKCPCCGAPSQISKSILSKPGIANQKMRCPVCNEISLVGEFKIISSVNKEKTKTSFDENKTSDAEKVSSPGKIKQQDGAYAFNLKERRNIIGRAAETSKATIQIPAGNNRRMSREHLIIDVVKRPNGYSHAVSLYKENVNKTSINNEILKFGDSIILNDGDIINLPDISVVFETH